MRKSPAKPSRKTTTTKAREPVAPSPDAALDPAPDPEGVAASILGGDSDGAPKSSTERVRAYRARRKAEPEPEPPPPVAVAPEDTAGLVAVLWETVIVPIAGKWKDGTPRLKVLSEAQAARMGGAYAPLVNKWAPVLGAWQLELGALIVTVAVIRECANADPRRVNGATFTLDDDGRADADVSATAGAAAR